MSTDLLERILRADVGTCSPIPNGRMSPHQTHVKMLLLTIALMEPRSYTIHEVANLMGVSYPLVTRCLAVARRKGLIETVDHWRGNEYRLNFEAIEKLPRVEQRAMA